MNILQSGRTGFCNFITRIFRIFNTELCRFISLLKFRGYYKLKPSNISGCKYLFNEFEIKNKLKKQLRLCRFIKYYKRLTSTQTILKKLAQESCEEGLIIVCDEQTHGYGRIDRAWSSDAGGLWFSILLRPSMHPDKVAGLALLLSIALNRTLIKYKFDSGIKWPNDIFVNGKKAAGILTEMSAHQDKINWVVAGIGVNINNKLPKSLADVSISLKDVLGKELDRAEFLGDFLCTFEEIYDDFCKDRFEKFVDEYNCNLIYKNDVVTIDDGYSVISGLNLGIDRKGRLVLDTKFGLKKIVSGTLRKCEVNLNTSS
ncbi:MAG: biotin--[acetyl-CoA-carboxylase] ligase [Endomicrobium sp.]|jgi:BirA family biotin operon repressor/biotin-[acetyl-CoA-carboxylase] ligase|nr:biotin--[acetyl-CoA-carboxylase] ligase [Endomicrobium sp.]